jgi:Cu/Ag efflux protein CusF
MNQFPSFAAAVAAVLTPPFTVSAQAMGDMKGMNMPASAGSSAASPSTTAHATGIVEKVDASAGLVTIAHEAIPTIGWPPMTMGFRVEDKKLFGKLVVGQKVDFDFAMTSKGYVVTRVK